METDGWQVAALFRVSRAISHRVKGLAAVVSVGYHSDVNTKVLAQG